LQGLKLLRSVRKSVKRWLVPPRRDGFADSPNAIDPALVSPIFVRGFSRSGGTLMVTILDAHPDVAMSYELYPELLELQDTSPEFLERLATQLARRGSLRRHADAQPERGLKTFMLRLPRGGLDKDDFIRLLREQVAAGMGFRTLTERLRFIERCCLVKMRRLGRSHWGLKCTSDFEGYFALWPNAHFVNMIRDGRDVLASQLHTGNFVRDPARIGQGWAETMKAFRAFAEKAPAHAHPVIYERLAHEPEDVIRELCARTGLAYSPAMLQFHKQDLTIFDTRHLSGDRISKPVDTTRIGRWRSDVSPQQLATFYAAAGEMMQAYGYLDSAPAQRDPAPADARG
jgi:hypothetical protein